MPQWIQLVPVADCPPGSSRELVAGERLVALFNVDGQFHVLDGICPHQGGPLGKGVLRGCVVTCPWHGWQFDVTTGKHETSPLTHPRLPVKVEGDHVFVDVDA